MKICILSPLYPISSNPHFGIYVYEQAKQLAKKGHEVHVITVGDHNDKEYEIAENVRVYRIRIEELLPFKNKIYYDRLAALEKKNNLLAGLGKLFFKLRILFKGTSFSLAMALKLAVLNKKHNFDIIHSHFVGRTTPLIGITAKFLSKPFIVTAYGIGLLDDNPIKKALNRFYLSFPSKVVCISGYVADMVSKYCDEDKIAIVFYGVNPNKLKPSMSAPKFRKKLGLKNEKILLSVCNLEERKGLDIIINALPKIMKKIPKIKYFIVGDGPQKQNLDNLIATLGLKEQVTFVDYVDDADLANFYNSCDLFILMSRTLKKKEGIEGFGIVYIEASYFSKPVIGGKSGGTADPIEDNVTGYRINPEDSKMMINRVVKILTDIKLSKRLGTNGKKRALKFLYENTTNDLIKVYGSEIKKH